MVFDEDLKNKEENSSSIDSPQNSTNSHQDNDSTTSMEFDNEFTAEKLTKAPMDWPTFMKLSKIGKIHPKLYKK
jgi:hypothetical protein